MPYTTFSIPKFYPPFPPLPSPLQPGAVSSGTFSGTYGTYTSSSANGPGPGCEAWSKKSFISSLSASVTGPLDGTANVATMASYAVPVPTFSNYTTKQALALAVGAPLQADVDAALGLPLNANLKSSIESKGADFKNINCYKFMIGEMGGAYNTAGVRTETVNSQLVIKVNVPVSPTGTLYMGLYNITSTGFQQLTLTVTVNNATTITYGPYTSVTSFKAAFENQPIAITTLSPNTPVEIKIAVAEVLIKGQRAHFQVILADPPSTPALVAASMEKTAADGSGPAQGALKIAGGNADSFIAVFGKRTLIESEFVPALAISGCVILVALLMTSGVLRGHKSRGLRP
jgi:hypothetical protein